MSDSDGGKGSGCLSFIIAGVIYVVGYSLLAGHPPGAGGVFHWWSIIVLFLLWGAVSAVMSGRRRTLDSGEPEHEFPEDYAIGTPANLAEEDYGGFDDDEDDLDEDYDDDLDGEDEYVPDVRPEEEPLCPVCGDVFAGGRRSRCPGCRQFVHRGCLSQDTVPGGRLCDNCSSAGADEEVGLTDQERSTEIRLAVASLTKLGDAAAFQYSLGNGKAYEHIQPQIVKVGERLMELGGISLVDAVYSRFEATAAGSALREVTMAWRSGLSGWSM